MSIRKILLAAAAAVSMTFAFTGAAAAAAPAISAKAADTRAALRDLWTGHIFWVRNVVLAQLDKNAAQTNVAEAQVVANARQIADSIAPFYGKQAADQLFELLKGHYGPIRQYLDAALANDAGAQEKAKQALTSNAGAIAKFLSGANPNLPYDALSKAYADEAKTWTAMQGHMNHIADALASGIAKQFPEKF